MILWPTRGFREHIRIHLTSGVILTYSIGQDTLLLLKITLNGEAFETTAPLTITALLKLLEIESRRVAVEHNLTIVKRKAYDSNIVHDGDKVEIVNFVGGG